MDYTFGNYGTAFFQIGEEYAGYGNYGSTAIQQADGKIVVVGETWNTDWDKVWTFAARLNSDGTLDNTFGTSETTTSFTLTISDAQTWLRPDPDHYTGAGDPLGYGVFDSVTANTTTPYNYAYVKFTPTISGKYDLKISDTTLNDSMFFVYDNTNGDFAINGTTGAITGTFLIGDDDSAGGFGFASTSDFVGGPEGSGGDMVYRSALNDLTLTADTQYVFVVSSYEPADAGNITFSVSGPAGVTLGEGSFAAEPTVLDLDQVGEGSADTNNSTGLVDWSVPVYIADSATVLGDDAPVNYKNLIISVNTTGWSEDSWAGFGVATEEIEDIEDDEDYVLLSAGGTSKVFDPDEYGGATEIKVQVAGTLGDGVVTLTFTNYDRGNIPKEDLNTLLQNIFFYEDGEEFSDTRVFNISVTDADDNVSEISTFSATWAPDTEAPYYDGMGNSDSFETPIPTDYFNAEDGNYISFYLNEDVTPVADKYIKLWKEVTDGDDVLVGSYEVTDENAVYVDGDEIEFYPNLDTLDSSTTYYFTVDAGAFKDGADNEFETYDGSEWSFTTATPSLGTWNVADADPDTDGVQPTVSSSGAYRGNLEISANGKYVVLAEGVEYKGSIGANSGLSVKKMNEDGTWSYVGEQAFVSTLSSGGLYDLVVATNGETDTLYTVSVSHTNSGDGPNDISLQTFKENVWVKVGASLNANVGATVENFSIVMQAPKAVLLPAGQEQLIMVAYSTNVGNEPKIEVKYTNPSAETPAWEAFGLPMAVSSVKNAFDMISLLGNPILGVADSDPNAPAVKFYLPSGDGFVSGDEVIPPLSMDGMTGDSSQGTTLKMALDSNGVMYAVYGKNDSSATEIAVSKINLMGEDPAWVSLPAPVDAQLSINQGMRVDLTFDSDNVPYLSLVDGNGYTNVYRFDETNNNWRELDTGSSLNDISSPSVDLEMHDGELNLLVSDLFSGMYLAKFEPSAEEDNSSVTLNVANPFTPNDAEDSTQIIIDAPDGVTISNATNSAVTGLPKNVKMPLGQFGFTLSGLEDGATVEMSMTADADFKQFSYFKKNLVTNKWVNIMEGVTMNEDGTATVKFSLTDGGVYDADRTVNGVIVDPGGVGENALLPMIAENTTEVGNVSLLDEDAATGELSYAITGGADSTKFSIDSSTGELSFQSEPDYESPTDAGDTASNNTYAVQVTVTGSTSGTEVQNLVVSVLNVVEEGDNPNTAPVIVGLRAEAQAVIAGTATALDDVLVADVESDTMTVTLSATNGTIGGLVDADANTAGIQLTGTAAQINTALAAATFTASAAGDAGISISLVDDTTVEGGTDITTTAFYSITASAAPTPEPEPTPTPTPEPTPTPTPTQPTTTVDGATVQTGTTTETRTTTDANGNVVTTTVNTEQLVIAPVSGDRTDNTGTTTTADVPLFWGESSRTEWATTASLPTGIGLTTSGSRAPTQTQTTQTALADLIFYIDDTTPDTDLGKTEMLSGGTTFLSALSNIETLVVNKVTLSSATTTASAVPITITGTANTIVTTAGTAAPVEALVIDASTLPRGTVLELKNVEFAVIVGDGITVRGGEGANIFFAGSGAQDIMLGEDDDELYAGDGDDTVGSADGDDEIFGESGNDTVFGGEGNDLVVGGNGNDTVQGNDGDDILQGGNSDAGTWTFSLDSEKQMHLNFTPTNSSTPSATLVGEWSRDISDRGVIDDRIALVEHNYSSIETIALLYKAATGSAVTSETTLIALDNLGYSAHEYAQIAYEYYLANTSSASIADLVTKVWGFADSATIELGNTYMANGGNWADAILYLANHDNNRKNLLNVNGELELASTVTGETGFSGIGDDLLFGGSGNDLLVGGTGNNLLDGEGGIDAASFVGVLQDYSVGLQQTSENIVDFVIKNIHTGDTNILRNIEFVKIGNSIYTSDSELSNFSLTHFESLAEVATVVGVAQLETMNTPSSWLS